MGVPAKVLHVMGLLAKIESTFGTAVALSTTADGVQLQYKDRFQGAPLSYKNAFDGNMGPSVSALGQTKRVAQSGLSIEGDLPVRVRPGGAAYSAILVPSSHAFMLASGFNATIVTSAGTESVTYSPTTSLSAYSSLTLGLYTRGELWSAAGAIMNAKFDFSDPSPPMWTFAMRAIGTLPTDAAPPAITYPLLTVQPPLATGIGVTFGGLTANAVVLSGSFDMQRNIDNPRVALSSAGSHLGFVPGDRSPIIKVTLESTALTTTPFTSSTAFDPYQLRQSAQNFAFALKFGSAQYNRYTINFPQAQVIEITPNNNGPTATVELTIAAYNSTPSTADDVNVVFD